MVVDLPSSPAWRPTIVLRPARWNVPAKRELAARATLPYSTLVGSARRATPQAGGRRQRTMIDAHSHVSPSGLNGPGADEDIQLRSSPDVVAESVRGQMRDARVEQALGMGRWNAPPDDPLGINGVLRVAALVRRLHAV